MPACNFKRQFVPKILDLSKPHTIRRRRKHPIKVGDRLMMFYGMRTKNCVHFADAPCVKIEPIRIYSYREVLLGETWLTGEEIEQLAWRDGFENDGQFFDFFEATYALPTSDLELIWWDPKALIPFTGGGA